LRTEEFLNFEDLVTLTLDQVTCRVARIDLYLHTKCHSDRMDGLH